MLTRRETIAVALSHRSAAAGRGYFETAKLNGRWLLVDPRGNPFWSIGMNHIDSASVRTAESLEEWNTRWENSEEKFLREGVGRDLRQWGFNTVGWTAEVCVRSPKMHRHSRPYSYEQYQWIGLPYCHRLPFAEFHQYEVETRHPDFFSSEFAEWCDYVARDYCARMAQDPNLIGYFSVDCPNWVYARHPESKPPLFDPKKLNSRAGREELFAMVSQYHRVIHAAIRRYDPNHLILGDRYEVREPLPDEILLAAKPFVDVFSFQYFADTPQQIVTAFERYYALTGKPLLLADASCGTLPGWRIQPQSWWGGRYREILRRVREMPACVGWHVCGAYRKNKSRGHGFRDEKGWIDPEFVRILREENSLLNQWVQQVSS